VTKSEHIRYSGSPIALSFDEANTQKSIVIAEFKNGELSNTSLRNVPCFQALAMVKTHLETLSKDITSVVESKSMALKNENSSIAESLSVEPPSAEAKIMHDERSGQEKIWLDIEIESAEYLQDLSARIEQIVKALPVEVLLVRRSKKSRQQMPSHEKKVTLSELSVQEVFDARMALEPWDSDEQQQRKTRLNSLYLTIAEQTQLANSSKQSLSEHSEAHSRSTSKTEQK
jgi:exonuclease SbcD